MKTTYRSAGVDIRVANRLVSDYKRFAKSTAVPGVVSNVGSFGALFRPAIKRLRDPLLVSSTDGVGTKLKIAFLADRHDTVGIDLVAMSTNDILCSGAAGLFFLDYISTGKIRPGVLKDVVKGIADGRREAGYALVGGETAEMPGMYAPGEYDLAGFGVGLVDRAAVIDGSAIRPGDVVLGLESSGLHSNGYSLVRKVFSTRELRAHAKTLLKPTRLYSKPVLALAKRITVKGIANITGGAFYDKIPRILPRKTGIEIDRNAWRPASIFSLIQKKGAIDDREMYTTFNMGIGMVLVLDRRLIDRAQAFLRGRGLKSHVIGRVVKGARRVEII